APPEPDVQEYLRADEAQQYSDAVINGDAQTIASLTNRAFQRMEQSISLRQQQQAQRSAELQSAISSIQSIEELRDPQSPVTQRTWQIYQQIVNNPNEMAGI